MYIRVLEFQYDPTQLVACWLARNELDVSCYNLDYKICTIIASLFLIKTINLLSRSVMHNVITKICLVLWSRTQLDVICDPSYFRYTKQSRVYQWTWRTLYASTILSYSAGHCRRTCCSECTSLLPARYTRLLQWPACS